MQNLPSDVTPPRRGVSAIRATTTTTGAAIPAIVRDTREFVNDVDELVTLEADTIEACKRARADVAASGDRLRRVHEAGVRLNGLTHHRGVRGPSRGLTPLQAIERASGISHQTANIWKKVGRVSADFLEDHIAGREASGKEATIASLLKACGQPSSSELPYQIQIKGLTGSERARFEHQLKTLGSTVLHTHGKGDTIVAAVGRLYEDVRRERARSDAEGVTRSPEMAPLRIIKWKS